jgi:lipopolysaccharide/colanic/teichoic acid biosynthesis glycosyltransferase
MNSRPFRAPELGANVPPSERASIADALRPEQVRCAAEPPPALWSSPRLGTEQPLPLWKRAIDVFGCLAVLPLLGICTVFMFLLTRCYSPGPVYFRQERVGYMGRRFKIYKFRTMRFGADCRVHQAYCQDLIRANTPMVKLDSRGDARLIPFAWVIRACGLDELPQIINVLRGEMSIVGPRPCIPAEFEQLVSWQRQRCDTLPGLTGLWQVSGKNRTTFEQMIRFDLQYARELSLWRDLKIMLTTPAALWTQYRETRLARKSQSRVELSEGTSFSATQRDERSGASSTHASSAAAPAESLFDWLNAMRRRSPAPIRTAPEPAESSAP